GLGVAKRARNRQEISQLDLALNTFQQRFKVGYVPSRLKLAETFSAANYPNVGTPGTLDADSVQFLTQMFPGILTNTGGAFGGTWATTGIDWNGNGTIDTTVEILEGDQCLVFFLGGIPAPSTASHALLTTPPTYSYPANTPPACLGFSSNPKNPADTTVDRIGPFFEFSSSR